MVTEEKIINITLQIIIERIISQKQIKDELQAQGFKIEKNQIDNSKQISSLGFHNVDITLYAGITGTIKVHLVK